MQFSTFSDFIAMGGHGFYVWLSYGISFLLLALLIIHSKRKNTAIIQQIRLRQKREEKLKQAAQIHNVEQDQISSQEVNS